MVKRLLIIGILILSTGADSLAQNAFATLRLNRTKVYPNQPIKATITVYTSTWFTEPLKFENLVIPNAFVIPFRSTQSGIHYINGKKFAGLEFFFLIYPYDVGSYEIAPFAITAVTPPDGDYKGRSVSLATKQTTFNVMDIPDTFEGDKWLVASNVRLSDNWDKPLSQLLVGDVINRSIRITVSGTLPSLIPELTYEELDFARIYPKSAETEDTRTSKQANGVRIERRTYLFEKEGEFILPAEEVIFWNPYRNKSEKRTLPEIQINVQPNANLGMMASVRDSLENTLSPSESTTNSTSEFSLIQALQAVAWFGLVILNLWLIFTIILAVKNRWNNYKGSSAYLKHKAKGAVNKSGIEFLSFFYRWWDAESKNPSVRETFPSQHLGEVESSYMNGTPPGNSAGKLIEESEKYEAPSQDSAIPASQRPLSL